MRLVSISNVSPGMVLAKSIFTDTGLVLIAENVELTSAIISRLKSLGIEALYVRDARMDDLEIKDSISPETRRYAMQTIRKTFQAFASNRNWRYFFSSGRLERDIRPVLENIIHELSMNKSVINLLSTIYASDEEIYSHSFNVTIYTISMGIKMGYSHDQIYQLGIGSILHDIGKMKIPKEILNKPGRLTVEEFEEIKKHTEYGFDYLRRQENIPLVSAHMAYQHHERIDGTGYPRGIKGDEIHPYSKILAVGDVYDALTSHRVYRQTVLPHEAMEIIYGGSGTQFEQSVVECFRNTVILYPIGLTVELSTGETGVVVDYNQNLPSRPIVRIIYNQAKEEIQPYEIDLSKRLNISIVKCDAVLF